LSDLSCTFSRASMAKALDRLAALLPARTTLPALSCVRVSHVDGGMALRLEATDLSRHGDTSVALAEQCEPFAAFCLPLKRLLSVAKEYPGVLATLKGDKDSAVFSAGGSRIKLPSMPGTEFPLMDFAGVEWTPAGEGGAGSLRAALSLVSHAIGTEIAKPAMIGVSLGNNGKGMLAVALDGPRLAKEFVSGWEATAGPATIPTEGVRALLNFFPVDTRLSLQASEGRMRFSDEDGGTLTVSTLDSPYPNYEQVIPRDCDIVARVSREALLSALRRVRLAFGGDDTLKRAAFTFGVEGILIHAETTEGVADDAVPADVDGREIRIGFSTTYMAELLSSLSAETVTVELKQPERATVWREEGSAGLRLLMPLRLLY